MEKYATLSLEQQGELLEDFCSVLITLKTEGEAVKFLVDLLTKEEVIKLAKRVNIARLLLEGKEYRDIERVMKASHGTIAKVAYWLKEGGEGFRLAFSRTKKKERKLRPDKKLNLTLSEWKRFKRRYPLMFWPSLLIEGIIEAADERERTKIKKAFEKLDHKSHIYKEVNRIFQNVSS